jgi:hypothetical protein
MLSMSVDSGLAHLTLGIFVPFGIGSCNPVVTQLDSGYLRPPITGGLSDSYSDLTILPKKLGAQAVLNSSKLSQRLK